uniref:Uncharacterized protein n=1 Tax=Zonotrichia albicollis TaxID=44394 RepID=A0A8D2MYT1_ZONAL
MCTSGRSDCWIKPGLWHSKARFMASMCHIIEEYSHPFKDDILVSTDILTYDTPDGPNAARPVGEAPERSWR